MNELDTIRKAADGPVTLASLVEDLRDLGLERGMTVLVHSSLSSIGWVCGGAETLIHALQLTLGDEGTLVMPTHTGHLSDPEPWQNPPVPESWLPQIRATMPPYNPQISETRGMGRVPEQFRRYPGTVRSGHPHYSFAAWGAGKDLIAADSSLSMGLGDESPLGAIYRANGWVLLIGVDFSSNTSLHLAEYRADFPGKNIIESSAPLLRSGKREWVSFRDLDLCTDDFTILEEDFIPDSRTAVTGRVGYADALLISQRELVDYAVGWFETHRKLGDGGSRDEA